LPWDVKDSAPKGGVVVPAAQPSKREWALTEDAFAALLTALGDNPETAAGEYEFLRQKLIKFFAWQGQATPAELCDETLNIVARKLAEGERVRDLVGYCLGVARKLSAEHRRRLGREQAMFDAVPAHPPLPDLERERRLELLDHCLDELPPESRRLLLIYYCSEKRAGIEARKALARELGIPLNALRIRAWRLRARLLEAMEREFAGTDDTGEK
jgi:DNA-directed RNA polymerase specialized sigma24 family protein